MGTGVSIPAAFRIRTSRGVLTPFDFAGRWLALIRCGHAAVDRCAGCRAQFGAVAIELAKHECRLVVAIGDAEAARCPNLAGSALPPEELWTIGVWDDSTSASDQARTIFWVVDPTSRVATIYAAMDNAAIPAQLLLDLVDSAQGRPPTSVQRPLDPLAGSTFGCVDWFEYPDCRPPASGATTRNTLS